MVGIGCLFPFEANAVFSGQRGLQVLGAQPAGFAGRAGQVGPGISGKIVTLRETQAHDSARQSLPKSLLVYSATPTSASRLPNLPFSPEPSAPGVVLDTNTLLDWLVFEDSGVAAVASAVQGGALRWLACAAMRDELARTLGYRSLKKWNPDSERTLAVFDHHTILLPTPPPASLNLRCSDPDDQVFIDLAVEHRASWLLTHDRALLRLSKRARSHGVCITQARHWPAR